MIVVTAGEQFIDIDAYAAINAYSELLNLQGKPALAVCKAPLASNITKTVLSWPNNITSNYNPSKDDHYVLLDISDYNHFASFVDKDRVIEVVDHHPGFEEFWKNKIGDAAHIEPVGACCTQIYERWLKAKLIDKMPQTTARLLICGILDNTLNLGAKITKNRDKKALAELKAIANLPNNWPEIYFKECQEGIFTSPENSIVNDTKNVNYKTFNKEVTVGQITLWDGKTFLDQNSDVLHMLASKNSNYFVSIISIEDSANYIYCEDTQLQTWLNKLIEANFKDNIGTTSRLWLRKEITHQDHAIAR